MPQLSLEIEGRSVQRIAPWYRPAKASKVWTDPAQQHQLVRKAGGWHNLVKHDGPPGLASKLFNANKQCCSTCQGSGYDVKLSLPAMGIMPEPDRLCETCGGTGVELASWEIKSNVLSWKEYCVLVRELAAVAMSPQHVHVSVDPQQLTPDGLEQLKRWAGWMSLHACFRQLEVQNDQALKPIFRVLTQHDLDRWVANVQKAPVDIKTRNLGLRGNTPYKCNPTHVGIEFRCGYHAIRDPQLALATLGGVVAWEPLGPMPLPVVDSSFPPSMKRSFCHKLNGDARWALPLIPWEEHSLFAPQAQNIKEAREIWGKRLEQLWPTFKFMGVQQSDQVAFALLVNEWFPQLYYEWANAVQLSKPIASMFANAYTRV